MAGCLTLLEKGFQNAMDNNSFGKGQCRIAEGIQLGTESKLLDGSDRSTQTMELSQFSTLQKDLLTDLD